MDAVIILPDTIYNKENLKTVIELIKKKDSNNLLEAKVRDVIYNGTYTRIIAVYRKQEIKINVEVDEIYNKGDIIYLDLDEDWVWLIGSNK